MFYRNRRDWSGTCLYMMYGSPGDAFFRERQVRKSLMINEKSKFQRVPYSMAGGRGEGEARLETSANIFAMVLATAASHASTPAT